MNLYVRVIQSIALTIAVIVSSIENTLREPRQTIVYKYLQAQIDKVTEN